MKIAFSLNTSLIIAYFIMKKAILFGTVNLFFLCFAQRSDAQCYVRMEDASGFNTDAYQDTLQAAAAKLCAIFDTTGFAGQFKVYDFGFYLHQESTTGGYPEAFSQKIAEVQALSPYYLLFGKQTDKSGVYTKFWVDLKLPETDAFSCLTEKKSMFLFEYMNAALYASYNSSSRIPSFYYLAEINAMDTLFKSVKKVQNCCFTRSTDCSQCASLNEAVFMLKNLYRIDISTNDLNQILGESCVTSSQFCDYMAGGKAYCANFDSNIAKSIFLDIINEFGCPLEIESPDIISYNQSNSLIQEEPKWGQLATCGEIISELNMIPLSGISLKEQAKRIADHFNCSTFYTRDQNDCLKYHIERKDFCLTPRYVYNSTYGWIDFHHVYKIFEWAIEQEESGQMSLIQSANLAQIKGYEGEVYQWLKGNESSFSYEDLCSNHIGAMFFINSYDNLKNGYTTWANELSYANMNMFFENPSQSPNYDYIPHVLDGNLPLVFHETLCLTGDELKTKHKQSFQRKTLKVQMAIKQVHFEFPD